MGLSGALRGHSEGLRLLVAGRHQPSRVRSPAYIGFASLRLTQTDQTFHESGRSSSQLGRGAQAFFAEVPAFVTASIAHDSAQGTNAAATCVALIQQLADFLASTGRGG